MAITHTLPHGLSHRQKMAAALYLLCSPCCGSGSGSGSFFVPCSVLDTIGGATFSMSYDVANCYASSGTTTVPDVDCGADCLFNAGTAELFTGASTDLGDGGTGGDISLQWSGPYWVDTVVFLTGGVRGLIEFAFNCYSAADGSRYLAFYARLTLTCYGPLGAVLGSIQYGYKTSSIAFESGNPFILSITGLSPFASLETDTCSCPSTPPTISIALQVTLP